VGWGPLALGQSSMHRLNPELAASPEPVFPDLLHDQDPVAPRMTATQIAIW
jgi:hypothetical protein